MNIPPYTFNWPLLIGVVGQHGKHEDHFAEQTTAACGADRRHGRRAEPLPEFTALGASEETAASWVQGALERASCATKWAAPEMKTYS